MSRDRNRGTADRGRGQRGRGRGGPRGGIISNENQLLF